MTTASDTRPGEGIRRTAAAERMPIAIPAEAHLDPRFKGFPNLPEDKYESILAGPDPREEKLAGALNVRTIEPQEFTDDEDRAAAVAAQVAQTIRHMSTARRGAGVGELEALARASRGGVESPLPGGVAGGDRADDGGRSRRDGAALVLEDRNIAWPEAGSGTCDPDPASLEGPADREDRLRRDTPFTEQERALLSIANRAAVALGTAGP